MALNWQKGKRMEDEAQITVGTLNEICCNISLREEVPPRLLYRALMWAVSTINEQSAIIEQVRAILAKAAQIIAELDQ